MSHTGHTVQINIINYVFQCDLNQHKYIYFSKHEEHKKIDLVTSL